MEKLRKLIISLMSGDIINLRNFSIYGKITQINYIAYVRRVFLNKEQK